MKPNKDYTGPHKTPRGSSIHKQFCDPERICRRVDFTLKFGNLEEPRSSGDLRYNDLLSNRVLIADLNLSNAHGNGWL
jgi:hypothetical protein